MTWAYERHVHTVVRGTGPIVTVFAASLFLITLVALRAIIVEMGG